MGLFGIHLSTKWVAVCDGVNKLGSVFNDPLFTSHEPEYCEVSINLMEKNK